MTNYELQALRKLLMLEVSEAAREIGNVSPRSWQYWESGRSPVPDDVAHQIRDLADMRIQLIELRFEQVEAAGEPIALNFYRTLDDYEAVTGKRDVVSWRLTQAVAATLYAEGDATLVEQGGMALK
ncbi:Aca2/YdiL-like domain-containing protein [Oceanimonas smirnovii]|uniref:Aca2/YdiL-like domain-containing protein n=1 Tax=Oceanimonas smirnovii TaxID=264574 RepID=UPI003FD5CFDC